MRKAFLITILSLGSYTLVQAQTVSATTTTNSAAKTPDTVRRMMPKRIKTRIVGGAQMTSDKDIIENISKSKEYTALTNSINSANLAETLKSRGPFTLFAPTNAAFAKLAPGTIDTLSKPAHATDLTRLLTYHVVNGHLTSKDIAKQIANGKGEATLLTLTGEKLKAKLNGDRNIVLVDEKGNEAIISEFDIEQSNGIIDVVTSVLTPVAK